MSIIDDGPRDASADLLGVGGTYSEALLPIKDAINLEEFAIIIAVVTKK
jgi:hypothetical protein